MDSKVECEKERWSDLIKNNSKIDFIVSSQQFKKVLNDIDNKIDKHGFIIDADNREHSKDGDEIRLMELGGLLTGSKVFIKENIVSFSEHIIEKKPRK